VWLLPQEGVYPEPDGAWLAGDAEVVVGIPASSATVTLAAGAAPVLVSWTGRGGGDVSLAAGERRTVTLRPEQGRVRFVTRGGFRPGQGSVGGDQRWLAAWVTGT
jgi:hypothetical protein